MTRRMHSRLGRRAVVACSLTILSATSEVLAQNILHVPADYPTIQAGIDAAQPHDTVLVAAGSYNEINLDYHGKAISVVGENGGVSIEGPEYDGTAFYFHSGETAESVLEGVTISFFARGVVIENCSPTVRSCGLNVYEGSAFVMTNSNSHFSDVAGYPQGGGSRVTGGSPVFERVTLGNQSLSITNSNAVLDHVILTGGGAISISGGHASLTDCSVTGGFGAFLGGGLSLASGSAEFLRCTFSGNHAGDGQGSYGAQGGGLYVASSTATFRDCTIASNSAEDHFYVNGEGGGAFIAGSTVQFDDCLIQRNGTETLGGGAFVSGGDVRFNRCTFDGNVGGFGGGVYGGGIFNDCQFLMNTAYETGGAAASNGQQFFRCVFNGNQARALKFESGGGGIRTRFGPTTVVDSLFVGNVAHSGGGGAGYGGGMAAAGGDTVRGCTFVANTAESVGGGVSNAPVANCVLWGNMDGSGLNQISGNASVSWSCVQDGYPGDGNIADDPRFVDPVNGNYRLGNASSCIDAGNNNLVPPESTLDLDGAPRFVDDLGSPNMGEGMLPLVDMGCYEFQNRSTGLNLRLQASCPDGGAVRAGWANATPNGNAGMLFAQTTGGVRIPNNLPCAGTQLGLGSTGLRIAWRGTNGPDGQRTVNGTARAGACGGYAQFIDLSTCSISDAIQVH